MRGALRCVRLCLFGAFAAVAASAGAQQGLEAAAGSVHGAVVNRDGAVYEGAHVALAPAGLGAGSGASSISPTPRIAITDNNGRFNFDGVPPGEFKLTVSSDGFRTQVVTGTLRAGESYDAKEIVLVMSGTTSEVDVTATPQEIVTEELKQEETQRVLGVIPNFYVTYVPNAPPLTRKQKYSLAWKSSIDPETFLSVGFFAGIEQATNSFAGYGQGAQGYAKRYGAGYADSFIGVMIGGAILPAWWKQDPRYFYKGTGTVRSRVEYAIANAVVCKGDNGHWQANYSGILGGLAAGGISNLYYPAGDRGANLTFENALIDTGMSAVGNLFQEFVVRKLTPHVPNYGAGKQ
ncbi:MAG: carboxypeptidase-like regulatory domain-containing protein [Terracidiphilus sp.]